MKRTDTNNRTLRTRFRVLTYKNPATGTTSFRVYGCTRQGEVVRENYRDPELAKMRSIELEAAYHSHDATERPGLRATQLSDHAIRIAETAFARLNRSEDLLVAVDFWIRHGKQHAPVESPPLDDAVEQFITWLDSTPTLRDASKQGLRWRVRTFAGQTENLKVSDITPETIDAFLDLQKGSPRARVNLQRAISRFMSWCIERPRRWATANPCAQVKVEIGDEAPPAILSLKECEALMRKAEIYKGGILVPYVALCLFGGLRPNEAQRVTWEQINLDDGEIRLESHQTKTGRARVVTICATLKAWLTAHRNQPIFPPNHRRHFVALLGLSGFKDKAWVPDVLRHTAASHRIRHTGSYAQTAEELGNSESMLRRHYQGRVTSADTATFYAIKPTAKGGK